MNSVAIGALAAALAVPLAFRALRRVLPISAPTPDQRPIEELRAQYGEADLRARGLLVVLATAAFWPIWKALQLFGALGVPKAHDAVYMLLPHSVVWIIPALFLSMVVASVVVEVVLRRQLRDAYDEFVRYGSRLIGFDTARIARPVYATFTVACLAGSALIANWYVYVTPRALVVNPFFSLRERALSFERIDRIVTAALFRAPLGNEAERGEYVVHTSDALSWGTMEDPSSLSAARKTEIMQYISRQSGVPIREVRVLSWSDDE